MRNSLTISEVFGPTIQGEGPLAGMPTVFVRTGGCDFRCSWCDSMYAVDPKHKDEWEEMSADDVLDRVLNLSRGHSMLVTLSGGNPALQPLGELIDAGHKQEYTFALETQGTIARDWFARLDQLVLSPKPPSSEMKFEMHRLLRCIDAAGDKPSIALKIVVLDEEDYQFARMFREWFPHLPIYLQTGTAQPPPSSSDEQRREFMIHDILRRMRWLSARVIEDKWFEARVSCQQHVLMWGDDRGV